MSEKSKDSENQSSFYFQSEPHVDMLKVLDTYRRSVDFYNFYGLDLDKSRSRPSTRAKTEILGDSRTFWDL